MTTLRRSCAGCGAPWLAFCPTCERCGCPAFVSEKAPDPPAEITETAAISNRPIAPVALSDVPPQRSLLRSTGDGDIDAALGGGLADCGAYLLSGGPGAGKTTLALRALSRLSGTLVSCEMPAPLVRSLCESAGIPTRGIAVLVPDDGPHALEGVLRAAGRARGLFVVDSLGRLPGAPNPTLALRALLVATRTARAHAQCTLLVISQQTKTGDARGSLELAHDVDGVIEIDRYEARVTKHRFGSAETRPRASPIFRPMSTGGGTLP